MTYLYVLTVVFGVPMGGGQTLPGAASTIPQETSRVCEANAAAWRADPLAIRASCTPVTEAGVFTTRR